MSEHNILEVGGGKKQGCFKTLPGAKRQCYRVQSGLDGEARNLGASLTSATDSGDLGQCPSPSNHRFLNQGLRAFVASAPPLLRLVGQEVLEATGLNASFLWFQFCSKTLRGNLIFILNQQQTESGMKILPN